MSKARESLAAIRERCKRAGMGTGRHPARPLDYYGVPALLAVAEAAMEYMEADAAHDLAQVQRDTISDDDLCRAIDRHSDAWMSLNRALDALGE